MIRQFTWSPLWYLPLATAALIVTCAPGQEPKGGAHAKYVFHREALRRVTQWREGEWLIGYLDADGTFVRKETIRGGVSLSFQLPPFYNVSGKVNEPVYEYRSSRLIKGKLDGFGNFVPQEGSTVIPLNVYLKSYNPNKSSRIYNLPGRIVLEKTGNLPNSKK